MASSPNVSWHENPLIAQFPEEGPQEQPPPARKAGGRGGPGAQFEWGAAGARALAATCATVAVVDVLSFTTTVSVAVGRGTEVFACADDHVGRQLAKATSAQLAVSRHEVDELHPWSLSPAGMAAGPAVARLVLPSPNGSAISAMVAETGKPVIAASLRNATAVVAWLLAGGFGDPSLPVAVIAAGERWADGSLRPAIEDLFASGLVLGGLADAGVELSAEASVAARSVAGLPASRVADLVRASRSGTELRVAGYDEDVEIAVEMDADEVVPVISGVAAAFRDEIVRGALR
ncbi:MAG: 2-phosphosulfolactate phosphatase [Acidimicrobiales bacterium]